MFVAVALSSFGQTRTSQPPPLPSPLTLESALNYAVEHNPALLRTREQIREQEGVLAELRANPKIQSAKPLAFDVAA